MKFLTDDKIQNIVQNLINKGKTNFDSHDIISQIMQPKSKGGYPSDYIDELWIKKDADDPFKSVHPQIAKALDRCSLIEKDSPEKKSSGNVRQKITANVSWRVK